MIKYYDKYGKEVIEGSLLLSENKKGAYCGFAKNIENQLHFCYTGGYCAPNQIRPLHEMDLSKIILFEVSTFNNKFPKYGNAVYYDDYGIEIKEGMSIFIGNRSSGTGGPVDRKETDLFFNDCPLSELFISDTKKLLDIVVVYIPCNYLTE